MEDPKHTPRASLLNNLSIQSGISEPDNSLDPFNWDDHMERTQRMRNESFSRASFSVSISHAEDPMSPSSTSDLGLDSSTLETVHFDDNDDMNWGCCMNFDAHWSEWKITKILHLMQAYRLGVKVGWRVRRVNKYNLTRKTIDRVKSILESGQECTITFETNPRAHLIKVEDIQKWGSASVEREADDMREQMMMLREEQKQSSIRIERRKSLKPVFLAQQVQDMRSELNAMRNQTAALDYEDDSDLELTLEEKVDTLLRHYKSTESMQQKVLSVMETLNTRLTHVEDALRDCDIPSLGPQLSKGSSEAI